VADDPERPLSLGEGQVLLGASAHASRSPRLEQLAHVYRLSDAALAELELEDLLDELLSRAVDILRVDTAAILLLDPETDELVARAAHGLEEEVEQGVRIPVGRGFAGRIAANRKPIFIADVDHADILNPILREKGIRSLLGVPLVSEGRLMGVLHVGSITAREFDDEDAVVLQLAAARAAPALERGRLFAALEREHDAAVGLQRSLPAPASPSAVSASPSPTRARTPPRFEPEPRRSRGAGASTGRRCGSRSATSPRWP
jgi:signal transduction protein with GAF and PtsI domain